MVYYLHILLFSRVVRGLGSSLFLEAHVVWKAERAKRFVITEKMNTI